MNNKNNLVFKVFLCNSHFVGVPLLHFPSFFSITHEKKQSVSKINILNVFKKLKNNLKHTLKVFNIAEIEERKNFKKCTMLQQIHILSFVLPSFEVYSPYFIYFNP